MAIGLVIMETTDHWDIPGWSATQRLVSRHGFIKSAVLVITVITNIQ